MTTSNCIPQLHSRKTYKYGHIHTGMEVVERSGRAASLIRLHWEFRLAWEGAREGHRHSLGGADKIFVVFLFFTVISLVIFPS